LSAFAVYKKASKISKIYTDRNIYNFVVEIETQFTKGYNLYNFVYDESWRVRYR